MLISSTYLCMQAYIVKIFVMKRRTVLRIVFVASAAATLFLLLYFFGCFYRMEKAKDRVPGIVNIYLFFSITPILFNSSGIIFSLVFCDKKIKERKALFISFCVFLVLIIISILVLLIWKAAS